MWEIKICIPEKFIILAKVFLSGVSLSIDIRVYSPYQQINARKTKLKSLKQKQIVFMDMDFYMFI